MDDLFSKMEQTKVTTSTKPTSRVSSLKFEIKEKDNDLLVMIKNLVNERELTYNDLYDKFGRQLGWNMIDGARKGQISWDRFKKWMDFLGMEIDLSITPKVKKQNK